MKGGRGECNIRHPFLLHAKRVEQYPLLGEGRRKGRGCRVDDKRETEREKKTERGEKDKE